MELLFDHTFGKQEQQDLVVCKPMAVFEPDEESEAIEHGWLALDTPVRNREVFYQSRSTRVDLQKFRPRFDQHTWQGKKIGTKIIDASEMVKLLGLPGIYKQYMKRKKFGADYDPFGHYHKRDQFMIFYLGTADNIVAFTKQKRYRYQEDSYPAIDSFDSKDLSGLESCIHANNIPISAITLDLEMIWAADNHVAYYYLGSGYENSSEYKAKWRGFQWWDGMRWSTDKQKYRRLCRRDSRINSFSDLGNPSLIEDNS
tara:strand:- start:4470 stop:5240 length:771 start_codon:yes stop_codon:yes gene_type:complete